MRLLIAEDDLKLLKSLKHIFGKNKYAVDTVSNGVDALTYAETEEYDGIVLDIMMPGIDGYEVCKQLRLKTKRPVIFMSALSQEENQLMAYQLGADDYIIKPFQLSLLHAKVIGFHHPTTGQWLEFDSPLPQRFVDFIAKHTD